MAVGGDGDAPLADISGDISAAAAATMIAVFRSRMLLGDDSSAALEGSMSAAPKLKYGCPEGRSNAA